MHKCTAWLFDVDGVLTNPEAKRVTQPAIFDELIRRIERNEPVGLNTGRSVTFVTEQILVPLETRIPDARQLRNVSAYCEYGAIQVTYSDTGSRNTDIDPRIGIPSEIQTEIRELLRQDVYEDVMFFDITKQTMVTVELKPGKTIAEFQEPQKQLLQKLQVLLSKHNVQDSLKIEATTIAIDIESIHVGKALGARKFIDVLSQRQVEPSRYVCIGDSRSDIEMFKELKKLDKEVVFVFVGDKNGVLNDDATSMYVPSKQHDRGTLEFLQQYPVRAL